MRKKIIQLMERTLSAYSNSHIQRYFDEVKRDGLTEHGFPRLTANIGILIAHGKRTDLLPIFLEMMEFCCKTIPTVKAANDFSVREICCCISEVEQSGVVEPSVIERWKNYLRGIDPTTCYNQFALSPADIVKNWAVFTGVSEFFRMKLGLGGSEEFIDIQLASQFKWIDENGMYMDGIKDIHHPLVYDLVPRALFAMILKVGYRGRYYTEIDDILRRAGLLTLQMQSPNGEVAFGGRSNQFLHNEPCMIIIFTYEAARYVSEGDMQMAKRFSSAITRAIKVTEDYLNMDPICHIKNRFPVDTKFGCEDYAYFDKYMITVASKLYAAYLLWDEAIPECDDPDLEPVAASTSTHFHKLFLKAGGYGVEFDLDADPHYDASGLGRVHKVGAPAAICMSVPCPSNPIYTVNVDKPVAASLCPGTRIDGEWVFGTDLKYQTLDMSSNDHSASAVLCSRFPNNDEIVTRYEVDASGVKIEVTGNGDIAYMLPALYFDGEAYSEIVEEGNRLDVVFKDWICRYTVNGVIHNADQLAANRNGNYNIYFATGTERLNVTIEILQKQ